MQRQTPLFVVVALLATTVVDCRRLEQTVRQLADPARDEAQIRLRMRPVLPAPEEATAGDVSALELRADTAAANDWSELDSATISDQDGEWPAGAAGHSPGNDHRGTELAAGERGAASPAPPGADTVDGPDPETEEQAAAGSEQERAAELTEEGPALTSIARETWVFAEPRWGARRLGYLRAGASVRREPEAATYRRCRRGWYRIRPQGYVCIGKQATLADDHPVALLSAKRPERQQSPYLYVGVRFPPPPLYARLPSLRQQQRAEPSRAYHLRKHKRLARAKAYVPLPPPEPIPAQLAGQVLPGLGGVDRGPNRVVLGAARVRAAFALLGTYEHEGRRFGLTTEMALLPLDRARVLPPSTFRGVRLSDEHDLPVAFVRRKHAHRLREHGKSGGLIIDGQLSWREPLNLTGRKRSFRNTTYYEMRGESWVRGKDIALVKRFKRAPGWAKGRRRWIDVSILRQTLVAYEGLRPIYATLISTGLGGIGDPKKTHATVQGTFLIHTKHWTVNMDGDEEGDRFDLRDVPFVQYFTEGYALHGAYWHDDFGRPRSHGCVNLAPLDAAWLFGWTTPELPDGWHAALSLKKGTIVHIHP